MLRQPQTRNCLFFARPAADSRDRGSTGTAERHRPIRGSVLALIPAWSGIPGDYGNGDGLSVEIEAQQLLDNYPWREGKAISDLLDFSEPSIRDCKQIWK